MKDNKHMHMTIFNLILAINQKLFELNLKPHVAFQFDLKFTFGIHCTKMSCIHVSRKDSEKNTNPTYKIIFIVDLQLVCSIILQTFLFLALNNYQRFTI